MAIKASIEEFADMISRIQLTDRWVFIGCDGDMGEGKSCFTSQLAQKVSKKNKRIFTYNQNMTFSRKELKNWIDGEEKDGKLINRKDEYSVILADELISMFFKRNWFDSDQIDGIELLNKCRDRHLCVLGNIPCFWDLDSAIYPIITFWVHIPERGVAWIFQKDKNPFATDKWHRKKNEKQFMKRKNPYHCINFICEIHFNDWSKSDKQKYYTVRNKKRIKTEGQRAKEERYKDVKMQRDNLMRFMFDYNGTVVEALKKNYCKRCKDKNEDLGQEFTNKGIAEVTGISQDAVRMIRLGLR
jgi:hypothetical protein